MDSRLRFSIIVAQATLIATSGTLVLMSLLFFLSSLRTFEPKSDATKLLVLVAEVLLPIGAAAWWVFPKLATMYTRREARAVATAFGVFSPVALLVGIVLGGPFFGAIASNAHLALFIIVGVYLGTSAVAAALLLGVCALTLRITRLAMSVETGD